ncbi:MAG: glutamate--cysteine ligase [Betaproteobacteria bacterium]|nr:glutamate--cysteine ligase [Betaproteobacteria bacterium]
MIPYLTTALIGPLQDLKTRILASSTQIELWFRTQWREHAPPFYCSVDLRSALAAGHIGILAPEPPQ